MTDTYTTQRQIGDYLSIYANEGDNITVKTEERVFIAKILETPNDVPTRKHQTKEVTCETAKEDPIICLYADVEELREDRVRYYTYGVEIPLGREAIDLGKIQEISVNKKA